MSKFIIWGYASVPVLFRREGEATPRAQMVAEHFLFGSPPRSGTPSVEWQTAGWAVEFELIGASTPEEAEEWLNANARHYRSVCGWIPVSFDPETGEEAVYDDDQRIA